MTVAREPLRQWRYPQARVLRGEVFASGRPPFAPFPTATNLMNANLCPVAVLHDLFNGISDALEDPYYVAQRGILYQEFIAHLKLGIRGGRIRLPEDPSLAAGVCRHTFFEYAQADGFTIDEANAVWTNGVEPWVARKLQSGELHGISSTDTILFELTIANPRTPFDIAGGQRRYPLRGRIDEIDLTRRLLIERTIKGDPSSSTPPPLKDFQAWLYWRALGSLPAEQLPETWRGMDFNGFQLLVETPHQDFLVDPPQSFLDDAHSAYAWIHDISVSEAPDAIRDVYANQQCSPETPHLYCKHPFINCFQKSLPHPQARPEIRRAFQPWSRMLLWEQMWTSHLWQYQQLLLSREELRDQGLVVESRVVSNRDGTIEVELVNREANAFRGLDYCTLVPFGTMHCGLRIDARLAKVNSGGRLRFEPSHEVSAVGAEALVLLGADVTSNIVKHEPPAHLNRNIQQSLFRLKAMGTGDPAKARTLSRIQLMEAVYGTRVLRRQRP